ncbi:hypothetical protein EU513_06430 [Yimella sp. RIT 621]|uniref:Uncharacterized protein n=1 Tax=Yimella lutea TaxID=587872 RepID=A0A542EHY6_9MICO|nr:MULTISPECIES: hypothetical protein [Yimella]RYG77745.1 hypothetical protein EU513_06430 [Yimella sp. RIT 621]TQJ14957.1 hypothetical protein FB459_2473 [Yimella lutea]
MSADGYETRTVTALRTGSKIALLCGLPLLGLAAYFYFTPLWVPKGDVGGVFGCGSAASPPDGWGRGACQGVNDAAKLRAIIALALGLLIPALGVALFGLDKRQERRPARHDDDDEGYDDRPAPRRTSASDRFDDDEDDDDRPTGRGSARDAERRGRRPAIVDDDADRPTGRDSARDSGRRGRRPVLEDDLDERADRRRRRSYEDDDFDRGDVDADRVPDGRSTDV